MKTPKIVRRFMYSYLLVLVIPLTTGLIIYQVSYNLAIKKSIQTINLVLNQSKDILDSRLLEIDRFARTLAMNDNLNRLLNSKETDNEQRLLEIRNVSRDLTTTSQSNSMLSNIYIYLHDRNIIIAPGTTYFRLKHYYENNTFDDMDFEQWSQMLMKRESLILPLQTIEDPYNKYKAISAYYPIPYNAINDVKGLAVVTIDENKLIELFNRITSEYDGWTYILNEKNQLIAKSGIEEDKILKIQSSFNNRTDHEFFMNDDLIISTQSSKKDWTIVAGLPKNIVLYEANGIRNITIITVFTTILLGLLICYILSYRNFAPILRILRLIGLDDGSVLAYKNEFDYLEGNISRLVNVNSKLRKEIQQQKPMIKSLTLYQILQGQLSGDKEIEDALEFVEIYSSGNNQTGNITILSILNYEIVEKGKELNDVQALRIMIKNYIEENRLPFYTIDLKHNNLILVQIFDNSKLENQLLKHEQYLKTIIDYVKSLNGMQVVFGVGRPFEKFNEMNRSFREAEDALRCSKLINAKAEIAYYKDSVSEKAFYSYPIDMEIRILNALKNGQYEVVCDLIEEIFNRNIKEKELSGEMISIFIQDIKATFYKAIQKGVYSFDNVKVDIQTLSNLKLENGMEHIKSELKKISQKHCMLIINQKNNYQEIAIKEIVTFIEDNYYDPNLGVVDICNYVKLQEKIISPLFKRSTGLYISEYLEKYRLLKAEELLINKREITIDEIATLTGYNSAHSFRRAFKRVNGFTPNQFRKNAGKHVYGALS